MLFINFLCLLYLMVLIDSHTISKGIDNDDKVNNNIDYINEVDRPTHSKSRRDKFQHKHKVYYTKNEDVALTDGLKDTTPKLSTETPEKIVSKTTPKATTEHKHHKSPKRRIGSFWRRLKGKDKNKQKNNDDKERKKRIPHHKNKSQERENATRNDFQNPDLRAKGRRKNRQELYLRQPEPKVTKRDVIGQYLLQNGPRPASAQYYKSRTTIATNINNFLKLQSKDRKVVTAEQPVTSSTMVENLGALLDTMTFNISNLKARYGLLKSLPQNMDALLNEHEVTYHHHYNHPPTTTPPTFQGTAMIEDMLDDIKLRASHNMVFYEKPLVTNMINTAVSFVAFDSYPMLRRVSVPSTGYTLMYKRMSRDQPTRFNLTASTAGIVNHKETVTSTESSKFHTNDPKFSTYTESHNLVARSIKHDTMTIAHNVEDMLQRELKNLYNKVKHKVSGDFRKEVQCVKSTVKKGYKKLTSKQTKKHTSCSSPKDHTCPCKTSLLKKKYKQATTLPRIKKKGNREDSKLTEDTSETPYGKRTYDDYMMLTLYEQMLARTHEDNLRRMLATTNFPIFPRKKRAAIRLSKRNTETLTNVKLREVVQNTYDDGGNMPDYDYIDPSANVSTAKNAKTNNNYNERDYNDIDYAIEQPATTPEHNDDSLRFVTQSKASALQFADADDTETIVNNTLPGMPNNTYSDYPNNSCSELPNATPTSFEALSDKISYNEYVNGYRHYLKFQKEQEKQNFSNLVKYQAHRHHSVDDIGKYILNKIPQLPSLVGKERDKRFSDDSENNNMDYQEITTKSDDSWFRKHFYFFLESGPPKKFHSSQTVELKSPVDQKLFSTEPTPKQTPIKQMYANMDTNNIARKVKESPDICLDDLTNMLKYKTAAGNDISEDGGRTQTSPFNLNVETDSNIHSKSFIGKLFRGKRRRDNKKNTLSTFYFPATGYIFTGTTSGKFKRSIIKEESKNTAKSDFVNKDLEEKVTTFSPSPLKEVFADAPQGSTRETNKYGYVDIDVVPRQTAVVNLRDNAKKSRIKNFFKKFHFKKKKKKTPKPKRSCYFDHENFMRNSRKPRFNPIKKLKSIFFTSEDKAKTDTPPGPFHMPDYDMENSAGVFKQMKFDRISLDEMKKQIPNISEVYYGPVAATKYNAAHSTDSYKLDDSDHDLLCNYNKMPSPAATTKSTTKTTTPKTTTTPKPLPHPNSEKMATTFIALTKKTATQKKSTQKKLTQTTTAHSTPTSGLFQINVKTLVPARTTPTYLLTYSEVKIGLRNKLHNPLKKATDSISKFSTTYTPSDLLEDDTMFQNEILDTTPPQTIDEGLVIQSKLTRIAKFPLKARHFKKRRNDRSDPGNASHGAEFLLEYLLDLKNTNSPTTNMKQLNKTVELHGSTKPAYNRDKEIGYSDYFSDLIMWHNDILNLDKVPNPSWQKVAKALEQAQGESFTTPNMSRLLVELEEMKHNINDNSDKIYKYNNAINARNLDSNSVRSKDNVGTYVNKYYDRPEIKSVAMDDHAVATSKNMIIKGEAKYFQYKNPKHVHKLRAGDFIDKLDDFNAFTRIYRTGFKRKGPYVYTIQPSKNNSESAILLDTSLMAYDDEVDSVTKSLNDSDMLMSIPKIRKSAAVTKKSVDHPILLKTNKAPEQHYTTPLPMASREFNEFLKANSMDVEYLTSPMLEMPTIYENWLKLNTTVKKADLKTSTTSLTTITTTAKATTTKQTSAQTTTQTPNPKKLKQSEITKQLSKVTKTLTTQSGHAAKLKNKADSTKNGYWDYDIDRYKRYTESSKQPNLANDKQRGTTTQEINYYNILRKKVKEKFEKKDTKSAERAAPAERTDPYNKDVEITIINFDDIEKITTHQGYNTYFFPQSKKNDYEPLTEYQEIMSTTTSRPETTTKEEIHNELLYKNALKDRTTSTTEYAAADLTQSTEYVDPMLNDPLTSEAHNKVKYPFYKIPALYPNIFNKLHHSDAPKRIHISSHHYKYDIFYDDDQKLKPNKDMKVKLDPYLCEPTPTVMFRNGSAMNAKITKGTPTPHRLLPTIFRKGTKAEPFRKSHKHPRMSRLRRKVEMAELTTKKRRYFTFRGCKPKPSGGLIDPGWHLESASLSQDLANATEAPEIVHEVLSFPQLENTGFMPQTGPISSASNNPIESWSKGPISDGEDLVTTYDKKGTESTTEDVENGPSFVSQFFSRISIINTESVRRVSPSSAPHASSPGSRDHDVNEPRLNNLGKRANNQSSLKEKTESGVDQTGALYKISSRIQNTIKTLMKNMTSNLTNQNTESDTKRYLKHWNLLMPAPHKPTTGHVKSKLNRKLAKENVRGPHKTATKEFCEESQLLFSRQTEVAPKSKGEGCSKSKTVDEEDEQKEEDKGEGILFLYTADPATKSAKLKPVTPDATTPDLKSVAPDAPMPDLKSFTLDAPLPVYMSTKEEEETALQPFHHSTFHSGYRPFKFRDKVQHHKLGKKLFLLGPAYAEQMFNLLTLTSTPTTTTEDYQFDSEHGEVKRVARQLNTFTAKDVAALEVVVDLMKNTLSYEDTNLVNNNSNFMLPFAAKSLHSNGSTNSIQVHIAIPFDFQKGKKRSAAGSMNPIRVRKVFSAKMSSPVDLEYQVHSFEGVVQTSSTKRSLLSNFTDDKGLTPGMYLLIDKPKNGFALKPVVGPFSLSDLKTRQVAQETTASMSESKPVQTRIETTSPKNMAKVTLSKDFISIVNQKLIEMYENMSRNHDVKVSKRLARSIWKAHKPKGHGNGTKKSDDKYMNKRRIDWETVKKYFGHDRVCSCKCRCNKTMCKACAASNAVIDELIFEFDNIGKYMADHCTEIQTFFWVNPIAGQKLRDSVNKIDKSLTAYYKRVKGKCQGRLCETFGTCVDKRHFTKTTKIEKEAVMDHLIKDLTILAEDLNKTVSFKICYDNKLKEKGDEFLTTIGRCIMNKTCDKRSNPYTTPKKMIKNVYSLDNINVNIICNPEVETKPDLQTLSATLKSLKSNSQELYDHLLDYDFHKMKLKRKGLGFKNLFPSKKSKLMTYLDFGKSTKSTFKRQVNNQVETPLISDGGGGFWYEYLKSATVEPRYPRQSDKSNIQIDIVQNEPEEAPDVINCNVSAPPKDIVTNRMNISVHMTAAVKHDDAETTTDAWSDSINRLLWLLGSISDVDAMNKNSNRSVMFLNNITKGINEPFPNLSDVKANDANSLVNQVKHDIYKSTSKKLSDVSTRPTTTTTKQTTTGTSYSTLDKQLQELTTIEQTLDLGPAVEPYTKYKIETTVSNETEENVIPTTTLKIPGANDYTSTKLVQPLLNHTTKTVPTSKSKTETVSTSTTTTETVTPSTAFNFTALTSTVSSGITTSACAHPRFVSIIDSISLPTPLYDNESTTCKSFISKLKSATMKLLKKVNMTSQTFTLTSELPITSPFDALVREKDGSVKEKGSSLKSSTRTVSENPTIVILNEYDSRPEADPMSDMPEFSKEGYRSLLLSIIQFETNNLNDEWDQVAYGGDKHKIETDMRRSVDKASHTDTTAKTTQALMLTSKAMSSVDELAKITKTLSKPESLLNKIASKIGIKIVPTKKKVANKQNVRDVKREEEAMLKRTKLQVILEHKTSTPLIRREACDPRPKSNPRHLCDIQATADHVKSLQASFSAKVFEKFVRNITCYKYKDLDTHIFIIPYARQAKRWDWIRNKRSLKGHGYRNKRNDEDDVNIDDLSVDSFERFVKGDDGIYKIINRRKRTAKMEALDRGLRNIPPLIPGENELYAVIGDSVTMDCGLSSPVRTCDGKFLWRTDREGMLEHDNVEVDGISLTIHNLQPRNVGRYTCSLDHTVRKNINLNVLTIPSFDIVFLPVYKTARNCSYDDLKAIQQLDSYMANETGCGEACSVRIDEPVCLRDKFNGSLIRATAIISMAASGVNCSYQCKRDIVASLVLLCAANTAFLSSIGVLMSSRAANQTLTPWKDLTRPVVTHTLRKKDTNGHHEYHKLVPLLSPGKVDVVVICPAGFYLLPSYKLCSSCPPNTASRAGDNKCRMCPRGTSAGPGAAHCRPDTGLARRYDWWWYPPGGYMVACCGVMFGCMACVLLGMIVHVVSRDPDHRKDENCDDYEQKTPKTVTSMTVAYAHIPQARPLSPSRVILPRFFRPSLTSSRATDSQETKFGLWKEKNIPPPLPPIDFDP